jgi:two-component system NtrC family sensor kinase
MPRATIPRRDVQRVVLNLLLNAVAAVPVGGMITVRAWPEGDSVVIEVRDTGPGFPEAALGEYVQPFVSTHTTGYGLGLAGSALLVQRAGGRFMVSKPAEGGAAVQFTVPAVYRVGQA